MSSNKSKEQMLGSHGGRAKIKRKEHKTGFLVSFFQNIGKALVFPIATLPAAAIMLRLGVFIQSFGLVSGTGGEQFAYWLGFLMSTPGAAVFDNLPLIFGIGVAFGFAKENRGEVALIGAISYFALIGLSQIEGSLPSMIYGSLNLGNGGDILNESGEVFAFHSDLLYLNIWNEDHTQIISSTWLMNFGVFGGILTGLTSALLYNKYSGISLPPALGFFSGRRFVPIVTLFVMIGVSLGMAIIWPWINIALIYFSIGISMIPAIGAGLYAFTNRMMIPLGLHNVLNTYFWFQAPVIAELADGSTAQLMFYGYDAAKGGIQAAAPVLGDINAFADISIKYDLLVNGEKTLGSVWEINGVQYLLTFDALGTNPEFVQGTFDIATGEFTTTLGIENQINILQTANIGMYQAGFYPTMMFGLPAIGLAIAIKADDQHKKPVCAFMLAAASVAFLTGITEPLEFAFMFLSPALYVIYAMLSGFWALIVVMMGISNGFGFSAGFIDWVISFMGGGIGVLSKHGNWANLELIIVGLLAAFANLFVTSFLIEYLDIATPGRNGNTAGLIHKKEGDKEVVAHSQSIRTQLIAKNTIDYIGAENIVNVDNCITRVRLTVKDNTFYDDDYISNIGYSSVVRVGKKGYQMIIGTECERIANEIKRLLAEGYGRK